MAVLPTIKIKHGDGFMRINESDFDPSVHEPWEEPERAPNAGGGDSDEVRDATEQDGAAPKQSTGRAGRRKGGK